MRRVRPSPRSSPEKHRPARTWSQSSGGWSIPWCKSRARSRANSESKMKIVDVEILPFEAGGRIGAVEYRRTHAALKIVTDEVVAGISRVGPGASTYVEQTLKPVLVGEDPANVERLWEKMYAATHQSGYPRPAAIGVVGSIDVALWDLLGKQLNRPVWQLLGGLRDSIEAYADSIPAPPGRETPEQLAETMAGYVRSGFGAVKLHL